MQVQAGLPEGPGDGRRAHQPGGVALVLQRGGREEVSHRRHLLADGDGQTLSTNPCASNCGAPCRTDVANTLGRVFQGGHVMTPLPAATPLKPGSAVSRRNALLLCFVFYEENPLTSDLSADVSILWGGTGDPERVGRGAGGSKRRIPGAVSDGSFVCCCYCCRQSRCFDCRYLLPPSQVFKQPWPGVMRTVYGNHQRFETTYFKKFPGYYVTGDGETLTAPPISSLEDSFTTCFQLHIV